jgi:predicted nucleotidyltransferase
MAIADPTATEMVEEITRRIVAATDPLKVILFGSRARGDARPESDFDLLVIRQSSEPRPQRAAPLYTALADLPVEVEVMVYTPLDVSQWATVPEAFITTAIREGRVLYERPS